MNLLQNISLKSYNTFGIDVKAKSFIEIQTQEELTELLSSSLLRQESYLVIGGGSNLVFVNDFNGLIVRMATKGIELLDENEETVILKVQAGENWADFVNFCIAKNWGGVENLAMIPGCVGATPVQNVGAYGVEAKDVITFVEAFEMSTGKMHIFSNSDCDFAYRSSVFKKELKNKYIVSAVGFRLTKHPVINTEYGAITQQLQKKGITKPSILDVGNAVCHIRTEKLPSPEEIGNAGSFFKNPIIDSVLFKSLYKKYPNMMHYPDKNGIKIAAGWLIEQCGWKGKNIGQAGVHAKQALVLVNLGNVTGEEVLALSQAIQKSIFDKFGIHLEAEANIIKS